MFYSEKLTWLIQSNETPVHETKFLQWVEIKVGGCLKSNISLKIEYKIIEITIIMSNNIFELL